MIKRSTKSRLFKKGPQYPFMMWIPASKSPKPQSYHDAIKGSNKDMDFFVLPINADWTVWAFKSLDDQMRFCEDLRQILTKC